MQTINIERLRKLDYRANEAYKNLRTNIQLCGSDVKVIMLTSTTPGEGKSTVSFNLAVSLAEAGKKVIFIDADLRKSVLVGRYKINTSVKGLTHFLSGINKFEEVMYATNVENFNVVFSGPVPPNPTELLGNKVFKTLIKVLRDLYDYIIIDTPPIGSVIDSAIVAQECDGVAYVMASNSVSYKYAQKGLEQIKGDYDYIFIDCPPSLGLLTINSLAAVDSVLIPIQCEFYALEGVSQLVSTIDLVKKSLNPELEIQGVILSMFDGRTNLSAQVVQEVKKYFGDKVYTTVIPRNVRLAEAPSYGLPITAYDPKSKGAEAYMDFAEEFLELEEE